MGDCSTTQPKHTGCAAYRTADRVLEEEEPLPDQASTQARQDRLEGKDSIVRFLRRTAAGRPEQGREYIRPLATEEEGVSNLAQRSKSLHMAQTCQIYLQKQIYLQRGPEPTDPFHALRQQLATKILQSSIFPCHKQALQYRHP
ncbi:hypothetical protein NDU88_002115 [Pleurodeles waltl]|uniref:Uncharacterized protein n=1 Tax=Pleurodeles waltl TaxID=8319 RepID=A0AAV7T1I2_PLEWA|nr:hypothetical protein NDU88_002115 [Pleurodeles waltl]